MKQNQIDEIISRNPHISQDKEAQDWIKHLAYHKGCALNSIKTYIIALGDYFRFCDLKGIDVFDATAESMAEYRRDLETRRNVRKRIQGRVRKRQGYAKSTVNLWMNTVSRYYDFLKGIGRCTYNPVGSRSYILSEPHFVKGSSIAPRRPIIEQWYPNDIEWQRIVAALLEESPREQALFVTSYLLATRASETCSLDFSHILLRERIVVMPAVNTKGQYDREIPFSNVFLEFLEAYKQVIGRSGAEPLFVSQSRRNRGKRISSSSWQHTAQQLAQKADCAQFHTHTLRHLRLTDLARSGYGLVQIASFAGHRSGETLKRMSGFQRTLSYINLPSNEILTPNIEPIEMLDRRRVGIIIENLVGGRKG